MSTKNPSAMERANPFSNLDAPHAPTLDVSGFAPKPAGTAKLALNASVLDRLSAEHNFPSRAPTKKAEPTPIVEATQRLRRRYTTGRDRQVNIKASGTTIEQLNRLADDANCSLAELFERALQALEREMKATR